MSAIPWILISVGVLIGILAIVAVFATKGKKRPTDYYSFFVMGIIWLPFGIIMSLTNDLPIGNIFILLGLTYSIIGLLNKDKWKKNRRILKTMNKDERKMIFVIMVILGLLVLAGLIAFYLVQKGGI